MSSLGQNKNLPQSILKCVTYFDIFSYPLTPLEIWMNLQTRASYGEVLEALHSDRWLKARLSARSGMWCLIRNHAWHPGRPPSRLQGSSFAPTYVGAADAPNAARAARQDTPYEEGGGEKIIERCRRYRASVGKLKKARRFARLLKWLPGIQAVLACNALGFLHTKPEGDIDLFIITRRGRIWLSRFLAVLGAELIGGRPKRAHAKDGLCLSFFATEGADMGRLSLGGDGDSVSGYGDIYYLYWMSTLRPLFIRDGVVERFWERNRWMHDVLPQIQQIRMPVPYVIQGVAHRPRKTAIWKMGNLFERVARAFQLKIMPAYLKDVANQGTAVVISDEILKFHDHDRRTYFREEFERRIAAVA